MPNKHLICVETIQNCATFAHHLAKKDKQMPIISITIGGTGTEKGIELQIPCPYRAQIYLPFIEHALLELRKQYSGDTQENLFIGQAINSPELWQWAAEFLDQDVMFYVDNDLRSKHLEEFRGDQLSKRKRLEQYYQENNAEFDGYEAFGGYLLQRFSEDHYTERLNALVKNFTDSIRETFGRVIRDHELIERGFLLPGKQSRLVQIIPSDSDLHKQGRQVYVLEFMTEDREETFRLIYKPSSILVDMMLFGNTDWLRERGLQGEVQRRAGVDDEESSFILSIAERINKLSDGLQLPTYRILPCENKDIVSSYGYIQYLSHVPWHQNSLYLEVLKAIERRPESDSIRVGFETVRDFEAVLIRQAFSMPNCDYVAHTEEEYIEYSRRCGGLVALATAFGISDMHYENAISSRSLQGVMQLIPIDCEVSCQLNVRSIEATLFFNVFPGGSMYAKGLNTLKQYLLVDCTGLNFLTPSIKEKNLIYCSYLNRDEFEPKYPEENAFLEGFHHVVHCIKNNRDQFLSWFESPLTKQMTIRILPIGTQNFRQLIARLRRNNFDPKFLESAQAEIFDNYIQNRQSSSSWQEPIFLALFGDGTKHDLQLLNIPVFYMRVTSQDVVDSHGSSLRVDCRQLASLAQKGEAESTDTSLMSSSSSLSSSSAFFGEHIETYFNETPILSLRKHIEKLIEETEYVEKLIDEAKRIMRQIYSKNPTPKEREEKIGETTKLLENFHHARNQRKCSPCCALF